MEGVGSVLANDASLNRAHHFNNRNAALLAAGFRLWRIGSVLNQESRGIQQLVGRQDLQQRLSAVVVSALDKVGPPLGHGFVQGRDFASRRALGVALLAGLAEIETPFVLAALLGGDQGRKQPGYKDENKWDQQSFQQPRHDFALQDIYSFDVSKPVIS